MATIIINLGMDVHTTNVSALKNDVVQSSRFSAILTTSLFEALRIFMF